MYKKYFPAFFLFVFCIAVSTLTRICIILLFKNELGFNSSTVIAFFIGWVFDIITGLCLALPVILQVTFTNNVIYSKRGKILTAVLFITLIVLVFFTHLLPEDYNKIAFKIIKGYVLFRAVLFGILCFSSSSARLKWRGWLLLLNTFIFTFLLLLNMVSEILFWQEFSVRYNFIAVDYLVYTNEVAGNVRESYPLLLIISILCAISLAISGWLAKGVRLSPFAPVKWTRRFAFTGIYVVLLGIFMFFIQPGWIKFSKNNFSNELAGNGLYQFVQAFKNNELDFFKFYQSMPNESAFNIVRQHLKGPGTTFVNEEDDNILRDITPGKPEQKKNVVLISVESLSASFMGAFGDKRSITPYLDSLAGNSLFFTRCYASGTRTVRGLEALSLSIPPIPGQSILRRKDNEELPTLGRVFKNHGYSAKFIYGGYAYFDNMDYFFRNNGYEVVDRSALQAENISFANIWGVADEDLFKLALREMDADYSSGRPFFTHIMTVSNHRPFTYPEGKIDISPANKSREGGVKYTDYAMGEFMRSAAGKPWFANTVFVIVADHCASSAGKQDLPPAGYHIPLFIFSKDIQPRRIETLTSQIDVAPTILGLLGLRYRSSFFGNDILQIPPEQAQAFISTYQGLGFIKGAVLVIQSPVKKTAGFTIDSRSGTTTAAAISDSVKDQARAFYQAASVYFTAHQKNRRLKQLQP